MVNALRHIAILLALALAVLTLGACGKKSEPLPKTTEERAADKAAAEKSVRDNAVWGAQVQSLDKAKGVQATVDTQAEDTRKKIEDSSK